MKIILLSILISSFTFAQREITIGYCKPNLPNIKSLNGVFVNGFIGISDYSNFSLKFGSEFNYQLGKNSKADNQSGEIYDAEYNIYKLGADIKFSYNKHYISPFLIGGLGIEEYNKSVYDRPDTLSLYTLKTTNKRGYYIKFAIGIDIKLLEDINVGTSYNFYIFSYSNYKLLKSDPNAINNFRESLNLYFLYKL